VPRPRGLLGLDEACTIHNYNVVPTWRINDPRVTAYYRTPFSNPQSQLFTID